MATTTSAAANVAQTWERKGEAPLSTQQQEVLDLLSQPCSRYPFTSGSRDDKQVGKPDSSASTTARASEAAGGGTTLEEKIAASETQVFSSSEEFYKWFADVETMYLSVSERKYAEYAENLKGHSASLARIVKQIDDALAQYDNLKLEQLKVRSKTQSVQAQCKRLSREREQLEEFASAVKSKLDFFDELQRIGDQLNSRQQEGSAEDYIDSLGKIDDCIAYLASNTQYVDSSSYLTKYRTLQHKALGSVRQFVCTAFSKATEEVQGAQERSKAEAEAGNKASSSSTGIESALLYVKFKAAVPDLQKIIGAIQVRLNRQDYARLMHDIQRFYSEKRVEILSEAVEEHLVNYQSSNELPMLLRLGCAYLIQVTQMEYQLYRYFFPSFDPEALKLVITPLCTILYEIVRPYFIAMYDVSGLCGIVNILKTEIIEEQFSGPKGESLAAMRPVIEEILADVQERLVYSMQHYIRDEIAYYAPTQEDLQVDTMAKGKEGDRENGDGETPGEAKDGEKDQEEGPSNLYPAVQNTLLCLVKTYGCLELQTFGGLAQEAIQYCTDSCIVASQEIAKSTGLLNSQLFLIKNLLALREQLSLFDVDFGSDETELDFSHMRDHMRRILRGESSLFALGSSNAVFQLLGNARPRINKMRLDSKKELEKRLKTCCESYIMGVTKLSVDPMLSFITKVTATRVASSRKALKDHAFATPSKLTEIVKTVNEALEGTLPEAITKMRRYLDNPNTHSVLMKPIKSNIAEAHGQIAHLLESEYDAETIEMVPLMEPAKLQGLMEGF
ncbi:Sec34 domain-containing protein [Chloropicon primus]|nr:Sec34 domain-containing protein [Chloropicon primus]